MKLTTKFHGTIEVTGEHVREGVASTIFKRWLDRTEGFVLLSVHFESVDIIKKKGKPHVLFIKMNARIRNAAGDVLPGIIFLRGAAVGILIVLECEDKKGAVPKKYVVLVESAMPAIGWTNYLQLPAGMMDNEVDPVLVALREMKEETGLTATASEMRSLTRMIYYNTYGVYPSPGACDETVHLFYHKKKVTLKQLRAISGRKTGLVAEHEHLRLRLVPLKELCRSTPDVKAHSAYVMYLELLLLGEIK
jgi:ADP-sugar diphosphatase